jgi:hypothetical protein
MTSEVEKKEEVKAEVAAPQTQPQAAPQNTQEPQKAPEETPEQINWKRFREERAKERKQKEESDRIAAEERSKAAAFKAALEAITNKPERSQKKEFQQSIDNEYIDEESEDEKIEKKIAKILQDREAKAEAERKKKEQEELPQMLVSAHKDFNSICTQENVDYLEYHYPEVAAAYRYMPDGFEKWSNLYQAVKRFVPNTDGRKEAKKAEQNLNKPQSASRAGLFLGQGTVPASSVRLSEEQKAANWERMQRELNKI